MQVGEALAGGDLGGGGGEGSLRPCCCCLQQHCRCQMEEGSHLLFTQLRFLVYNFAILLLPCLPPVCLCWASWQASVQAAL